MKEQGVNNQEETREWTLQAAIENPAKAVGQVMKAIAEAFNRSFGDTTAIESGTQEESGQGENNSPIKEGYFDERCEVSLRVGEKNLTAEVELFVLRIGNGFSPQYVDSIEVEDSDTGASVEVTEELKQIIFERLRDSFPFVPFFVENKGAAKRYGKYNYRRSTGVLSGAVE